MTKRFMAAACIGFAIFTGFGTTTSAEPTVLSPDLTVERIADGVWLHTSWHVLDSGERVLSNGLVVELEDKRVVLVDTAWGDAPTIKLLDWVKKTLKPSSVEAVITHFHADRMGGSAILVERNITFVAHPLTVELGENEGVPLPAPLPPLAIGEALSRSGVEIFYPGPAHTRDNIVVWVPHARILFGGCAVRPGKATGRGNVADADVMHWPTAIRLVQQRYETARIVVPSHGPPGDSSLLSHTIALFSED